ncbi:MAG: hypothetical protein MR867_00220 [Eubacterium sp.]|nr:hypothetical protein [Eubacterium sp.]MDD7208619.1 hypothetical protein [Lachnospiraceae bacterium]MDY5497400.1 hypothetical protein [Anaerobutyricum sp.]
MDKKRKAVYCNKCKKEIAKEDYLFVAKEWGYFSEKDGQIHRFRLCESCYDNMVKQFLIPVEVEEQTELL